MFRLPSSTFEYVVCLSQVVHIDLLIEAGDRVLHPSRLIICGNRLRHSADTVPGDVQLEFFTHSLQTEDFNILDAECSLKYFLAL